MKIVYLLRGPSTDEGTFGHLLCQGGLWAALELPDRDNQRSISSIPADEYICTHRHSPHFGRVTPHITDVEGRTYILMHSANFAGDVTKGYQSHLNGCVALGKGTGRIKNKFGNFQRAILTSRTAIREFEEYIDGEDFQLIIKDLM